jgi:hypothetical protein
MEDGVVLNLRGNEVGGFAGLQVGLKDAEEGEVVAMCSRACSTAARACWPCWWIELALPKCSIQKGRMASKT